MPKNYYIILGISANSSQQDIKAAYRRLAKEFHPDRFQEGHSSFLVIQEAYSVLGDPSSRKEYDRSLREERSRIRPVEKTESFFRDESVEPLFPDRFAEPVDDIGSAYFSRSSLSGFDSMFDRLFGHFFDTGHSSGRDQGNLALVISLTPQQAQRGGHIRLVVPNRLRCPDCGGRGGRGLYECRHCGGVGSLPAERPIRMSYPPGISNLDSLRVPLDQHGIPRDLIVTFKVRREG